MPIEIAIWKVNDEEPDKISYSPIDSERKLENIISKDLSILGDDFLLIGRQVKTAFGKSIDLLAINPDGKLSVIELKKDKTPREVVAQALDYASWVQNLSYQDITQIFEDKIKKKFELAFAEKFNVSPPDDINQSHDILIVCAEIDGETERIVNYLSDNYNVPVNVVFFRFFKDGNSEYITRSWLIDPMLIDTTSSSKTEKWNGRDFIANVDVGENGVSSWEDAVKYGFISAGGGRWYSRTLNQLFPGARVFAMQPKKGYLGVGIVQEKCVPAKEFSVTLKDGTIKPIMEVKLKAEWLKNKADDPDMCEYFVKVKWLKTVPEKDAYWEKGLRANQNSAYKLRSKYTLEKLQKFFGLED